MPRRWRRVSMDELQHIWDDLRNRGEWYNGCTWAELLRIYGNGNVIHRSGHGWYKLATKK